MANRMRIENNKYYVYRKKRFKSLGELAWGDVQAAFDFAYNMTFGERGEHRDHRSGGEIKRTRGEIFKDTFQGKLAECALRDALKDKHEITLPGRQVWQLGRWDEEDFIIDGMKASVKSTKAYGQLLLLEAKDYNSEGVYLPNKDTANRGEYDIFVLVRMRPFCEDIMREAGLLDKDKADYNDLMILMEQQTWEFDIPGYITREDLKRVIAYPFFLPKGGSLNGKVSMDADNYYVQAGDLRPIEKL